MPLKQLFISSLLVLTACGTAQQPEINRAENLMVEHPDSALKILQGVDVDDIGGRKNRAKYALLYSQALDKNYVDVDNDSLIRIARDYYEDHGSDLERAQAFYYYGTVANNAGDIDGAMQAYVPAKIYAEKTDDEYIKGLVYSAIGSLYHDQNSLDEATHYLIRAAKSFESIGLYRNQIISLKNVGKLYRLNNKPDSALYALNNAKNIALNYNDTVQLLDTELKIQNIIVKNSNDKKEIEDCKMHLFDIYHTLCNNSIPTSHYPLLGQIYLKQNKIDSAKLWLTTSLNFTPKITYDNLGIYIHLANCEKQVGNYKDALRFRELYSHLHDSITEIQNNTL